MAATLVPLVLLAFYCCVAAATTIKDDDGDVNEWLAGLLNVRIVGNDTRVRVPGYMYDLYGNNANGRYDVIRNIWPTAESIGSRTRLMYDVSELEPNETVKKAVLQLDSPRPRNKFSKAIEVSFYSSAKRTKEKSYLGSTRIRNILELDAILGSKSVTDLGQLIVYTENTANPPMGLLLYSTTPEDDRHQRSHELATLMFKTEARRHKRSVIDNEVDDFTPKNSRDEQKRKKKKKQKEKGQRNEAKQTTSGGHGRFDRVHQEETVQVGETDVELCGHRLAGLGDLPEGFRDQLLHGRLRVPVGPGHQADQPRDSAESGQNVRPVLGDSRAVLRARDVGARHAALHGPLQPRDPEKLPGHERVDMRVQLIRVSRQPSAVVYIIFLYLFQSRTGPVR